MHFPKFTKSLCLILLFFDLKIIYLIYFLNLYNRLSEIKSKDDILIPENGRPKSIPNDIQKIIELEIKKIIDLGWVMTPSQARIFGWEVLTTWTISKVNRGDHTGWVFPEGDMMTRHWWRTLKSNLELVGRVKASPAKPCTFFFFF